MSTQLEIHPIQADILRVLLFQPQARFSELNTTNITSDHFNFHVKRLIEIGIIEKKEDKYQLTTVGKEFANRFDTDSTLPATDLIERGRQVLIEKQAKVGVLVCGVKTENKIQKHLVQQRLKQPYFGFYGFITGKSKWGETTEETAARELKEETGLTADLTLVGIKHKMDYSKKGELLEDKHFFVFRASNTKGNLIKHFEGGKNSWMTEDEINELSNLFDGVDESIEMIKQNSLVFSETKYTVSNY